MANFDKRLHDLETAWNKVDDEDGRARRERVFAELDGLVQRRWDSILADITDEERRWIYEPANNEERAKGIKVVERATARRTREGGRRI
jgi:hypothetical protein